ncbi:hypothetical protein [Chlamydia caviae]|uniref:Type III secretion translocator n=1 Tax=Chlamydia caviae (strain ATCC VR-813 / DSM 19441 / 03DC25 / GPIC) TaxID=227941 RepID=Q822E2_CHLCV|nr:hypothetical protein [Chlamydia caviae]AAP05482.1 conserved hypothetical protein [Chlamydia caviae GPIC]
MSSWLAQSTEILLNQQPYIPDSPKQSEALSDIKYSITLAPESLGKSLKLFSETLTKTVFTKNEGKTVLNKQLTLASAREKILHFGSSLASQLPKKAQSSSSSSPWNLFSQKNSKESMQALLKDLIMPKTQEKAPEKSSRADASLFMPKPKQSEEQPKTQRNLERTEIFRESTEDLGHKMLPEEESLSSRNADLRSKEEERPTLKSPLGKYSKGLSQDEHPGKQQHQECFFKKFKKNHKTRAASVVPVISPPSLGVFTLSYLLTKQGILSDFSAYASYKDCVETTQKELEATHAERITQLQKYIEKEAQAKRWGSIMTVIEWILPWISVGTSATLVIMGGGLFCWLGLIGALIMLVLTLLDTLNGWEKIEKLLPGKNKQKKQQILKTIQISLYIIATLLLLVSLKTEGLGFSKLTEGIMSGIGPAVEGALGLIRGCMLWIQSRLSKIKARYLTLEAKIELLNFERDDHVARTQELIESIHDSLENLGRVLQLCREIDRTFLEALR